jgi:hypothetical protein
MNMHMVLTVGVAYRHTRGETVRVHDEVRYLTTMSKPNKKAAGIGGDTHYATFVEGHVFLVYDAAHNTLLAVSVACDAWYARKAVAITCC